MSDHPAIDRRPLSAWIAPGLWQAITSARDAALAAGAAPERAQEAAWEAARAVAPALPAVHLREALAALAALAETSQRADDGRRPTPGAGLPITFRLTPIADRLWHAAWCASRHGGPCLVGAVDEDQARRLAMVRFDTPAATMAGGPWRRADLVRAEAGGRLPRLPHGLVVPVVGRVGPAAGSPP